MGDGLGQLRATFGGISRLGRIQVGLGLLGLSRHAGQLAGHPALVAQEDELHVVDANPVAVGVLGHQSQRDVAATVIEVQGDGTGRRSRRIVRSRLSVLQSAMLDGPGLRTAVVGKKVKPAGRFLPVGLVVAQGQGRQAVAPLRHARQHLMDVGRSGIRGRMPLLAEPAHHDGLVVRVGIGGSGLVTQAHAGLRIRPACVPPVKVRVGDVTGEVFRVRFRGALSRLVVHGHGQLTGGSGDFLRRGLRAIEEGLVFGHVRIALFGRQVQGRAQRAVLGLIHLPFLGSDELPVHPGILKSDRIRVRQGIHVEGRHVRHAPEAVGVHRASGLRAVSGILGHHLDAVIIVVGVLRDGIEHMAFRSAVNPSLTLVSHVHLMETVAVCLAFQHVENPTFTWYRRFLAIQAGTLLTVGQRDFQPEGIHGQARVIGPEELARGHMVEVVLPAACLVFREVGRGDHDVGPPVLLGPEGHRGRSCAAQSDGCK